MILQCNCYHEAQDSFHGKGNRVHNYAVKKGGYKCTVCGNLKTMSVAKEEKKPAKK